MSTGPPDENFEQQLREMNEALLVSSVRQHEMTQQAQVAAGVMRESEARYRTLFELVPVAVYSCDASGVVHQFNRRAAELWGREPLPGDTDERFCGSFKMFRPDGSFMPHHQCPMAEVLSGRITELHDAEVLIERLDGSRITVLVNICPLKDQRGELLGAINCFVDITERKETEVRHALLARELQHRTKNMLSVIQSIAERSMADGRPLDEARKALIARLHALAHATDLLSDADFQGASINDVVGRALETFAGRYSLEGEHVLLSPGATQSLTLVVHELCTNANKYGAYSTPGGRVAIRWSIEEAGDEPKLTFQWQERGGPPVAPPKRTSFGTTLLQLAIGGAETPPVIDYSAEGLTYSFEAPLAAVAATSN
jgi:two-component sensor histidine kinase